MSFVITGLVYAAAAATEIRLLGLVTVGQKHLLACAGDHIAGRFRILAHPNRFRLCRTRLRGLWRCLYRRLAALALGCRTHAARPLGSHRRGNLPRRCRGYTLRSARRSRLIREF